jgi:hypothetical protein
MSVSLKCRGFSGSFLRARNWSSFAYRGNEMLGKKAWYERGGCQHTWRAGSGVPVDSGGIPQFSVPGMGGGCRSALILNISSSGSLKSSCSLGSSCEWATCPLCDDSPFFSGACDPGCLRCPFCEAEGRLMITWDLFEDRRSVKTQN